jgi:hypothetical protein
MEHRPQIREGFDSLAGGAIVRETLVIGASEGTLIVDRTVGQGGRDEKTDYQQSESNRLA